MASTTSPTASARKPYYGSCHCGTIRYISYLTLPPTNLTPKAAPESSVRIRKCNCTTCQKMSFFHVRLPDAPSDFVLLSPIAPAAREEKNDFGGLDMEKIGDYTCFGHMLHWLFCKKCAVRCFIFAGHGEIAEIEVPAALQDQAGESGSGDVIGTKRVRAWRPRKDGWKESRAFLGSYLSVNAVTLEAGQEGANLMEWSDKGWVLYLDCLKESGKGRFEVPFEGGMY